MERRFMAIIPDHGPRQVAQVCDVGSTLEDSDLHEDHQIVHFRADGSLLDREFFYLAYTVEDEGPRVCGIFLNDLALRHYRSEHILESPMRTALAMPMVVKADTEVLRA